MSEKRVPELPAPEGQRVELFDVPWEVYEALGEAFRDRPVFLT
jgi:hypothetical protein